jgi:nucleoside-diphosphate-sugar epimerase
MAKEGETILISGIGGFIGSFVAEEAAKRGCIVRVRHPLSRVTP